MKGIRIAIGILLLLAGGGLCAILLGSPAALGVTERADFDYTMISGDRVAYIDKNGNPMDDRLDYTGRNLLFVLSGVLGITGVGLIISGVMKKPSMPPALPS